MQKNILRKLWKKEKIVRYKYKSSKIVFQTRVSMLNFAGNYSHDGRFEKTDWLCWCKLVRKKERHLTLGQCPVYGDLVHEATDLNNDAYLVQLFTPILERREKLKVNS